MKHYVGTRIAGQAVVKVDGQIFDPRLDLRRHSLDGFEWGYAGSGPAQLALAFLVDHLRDVSQALAYYQDFKFAVVAGLDRNGWILTGDEIQRSIETFRPALRGMSSQTGNMKGGRP